MVEIIHNPSVWFMVALAFNIFHTLFHVAFFYGYNSRYLSIGDGMVGYFGAISVFIFLYLDRATFQFPVLISLPVGIALFAIGLYIHLKAQLDFHKYNKKMPLVTRGIYEYFRHPMYLGWSIVVVGAVLVANSILGLMTSWIWILLIAICGYLEEIKFRHDLPPGEYDGYSKKTWL